MQYSLLKFHAGIRNRITLECLKYTYNARDDGATHTAWAPAFFMCTQWIWDSITPFLKTLDIAATRKTSKLALTWVHIFQNEIMKKTTSKNDEAPEAKMRQGGK